MSGPVVVAFAHPGEVQGGFATSLLTMFIADHHRDEPRLLVQGGGFLQVCGGPRIAAARNQLVRSFLTDPAYVEAEWMLMLDSDMTFQHNLLDVLLSATWEEDPSNVTRPVIGGLCFGGGRGRIFPTMYRLVDPAQNEGVPVAHITDWPENALVQVDATGCACLLIHRPVLEKLQEVNPDSPVPWFAESVYLGQEFGEDWTFCLRVGQLGHSIYVATAAKLGHVKSVTLDEDLWRTGKIPLTTIDGMDREEVVATSQELTTRPATGPQPTPPSQFTTIAGPNRAQRRAAKVK